MTKDDSAIDEIREEIMKLEERFEKCVVDKNDETCKLLNENKERMEKLIALLENGQKTFKEGTAENISNVSFDVDEIREVVHECIDGRCDALVQEIAELQRQKNVELHQSTIPMQEPETTQCPGCDGELKGYEGRCPYCEIDLEWED